MAQHDIEIIIEKNGQVKIHVKGVKGKGCMEYAKWLTDIIGKVQDQTLTSEYYEPEEKARVEIKQDVNLNE